MYIVCLYHVHDACSFFIQFRYRNTTFWDFMNILWHLCQNLLRLFVQIKMIAFYQWTKEQTKYYLTKKISFLKLVGSEQWTCFQKFHKSELQMCEMSLKIIFTFRICLLYFSDERIISLIKLHHSILLTCFPQKFISGVWLSFHEPCLRFMLCILLLKIINCQSFWKTLNSGIF